MSTDPIPASHAARRAEAHEARSCGLPHDGRTLVASSTFDALVGARDELRRDLDAALERAIAAERELRVERAYSAIVRDQRDAAEMAQFTAEEEARALRAGPVAYGEHTRAAVAVVERKLAASEAERRELQADLDAACTHLDVTGEANCECGDHIRPLGDDRCSWCQASLDEAGL